ncbi:MAG: hypothetical protein JNG89_09515 [Planctomycetaceae bacterium]|nr:hypothetical protein [Planctomycetaceae bacterium]
MRKRLMTVAAIGLLIAGAWLGNLFRGFGLGGSGTGDGNGEAPSADTQINAGPESTTVSLTSSARSVARDAAVSDAATDSLLTVLVVEDHYEVQSGADEDGTFAPATLEALVEQAKVRPGDEHGVRVRLRFRRNAQSGAISDLYAALQSAGIPREQIIEATGYVE